MACYLLEAFRAESVGGRQTPETKKAGRAIYFSHASNAGAKGDDPDGQSPFALAGPAP